MPGRAVINPARGERVRALERLLRTYTSGDARALLAQHLGTTPNPRDLAARLHEAPRRARDAERLLRDWMRSLGAAQGGSAAAQPHQLADAMQASAAALWDALRDLETAHDPARCPACGAPTTTLSYRHEGRALHHERACAPCNLTITDTYDLREPQP